MPLSKYCWKNAKNTANEYCPNGTWKDYWVSRFMLNHVGYSWPNECQVEGCTKKAELGAHICQPRTEIYTYIIPMCKHHNNSTEIFDIKDPEYLVEV